MVRLRQRQVGTEGRIGPQRERSVYLLNQLNDIQKMIPTRAEGAGKINGLGQHVASHSLKNSNTIHCMKNYIGREDCKDGLHEDDRKWWALSCGDYFIS